MLAINQATGVDLPAALDVRQQRAATGRWEELVPLGALLTDLGEIDEAERTYLKALQEYPDVSPFALGWVCFQLGVLWGEGVPVPEPARAAQWYRKAIDYLPCYVKARVHLSEILLDHGDPATAQALLSPAGESGDPEVSWRLADAASAIGAEEKAVLCLEDARVGFEALLARHPLAFSDHAAEFYLGSGDHPRRAFELARLNLANRPTARAFELFAEASDRCGESICPIAEHS
jgi:tetratricopeptide (TPR) repeat protein